MSYYSGVCLNCFLKFASLILVAKTQSAWLCNSECCYMSLFPSLSGLGDLLPADGFKIVERERESPPGTILMHGIFMKLVGKKRKPFICGNAMIQQNE